MTNVPVTNVPAAARQEVESANARRKQAPVWTIGAAAVVLALGATATQVAGIVQASALNWELGTALAWTAIALSVAAIIVGLTAVILNRGRRLAWPAVLVGLVANPVVLVQLFRLLG